MGGQYGLEILLAGLLGQSLRLWLAEGGRDWVGHVVEHAVDF